MNSNSSIGSPSNPNTSVFSQQMGCVAVLALAEGEGSAGGQGDAATTFTADASTSPSRQASEDGWLAISSDMASGSTTAAATPCRRSPSTSLESPRSGISSISSGKLKRVAFFYLGAATVLPWDCVVLDMGAFHTRYVPTYPWVEASTEVKISFYCRTFFMVAAAGRGIPRIQRLCSPLWQWIHSYVSLCLSACLPAVPSCSVSVFFLLPALPRFPSPVALFAFAGADLMHSCWSSACFLPLPRPKHRGDDPWGMLCSRSSLLWSRRHRPSGSSPTARRPPPIHSSRGFGLQYLLRVGRGHRPLLLRYARWGVRVARCHLPFSCCLVGIRGGFRGAVSCANCACAQW